MKKLLLVLMLVGMSVSCAFAQEMKPYFYPTEEDAEFSITIPKSWEVEIQGKGKDMRLSAAQEGIAFVIIPLSAEKVEKMSQELWDAIVTEPLKEMFTDIEYTGDPDEEPINDIEFWTEYATAKDIDDGTPVSLRTSVFYPSDETTCLFYAFGNEEGMKKYNDELATIIQSIQLPEE